MKVEWVNHASFVIELDGVRLISDPWIDGTAFGHGWRHIVPTMFRYEDFANITHLWLSHEHPDHFSPKNLQSIPVEIRAGITMLYHEGVDDRIGAFCRNSGFKSIHELRAGEWFPLGADTRVRCEGAGSGDTWIAVRSGDETIVNVNDAYLAHSGARPAPQRSLFSYLGRRWLTTSAGLSWRSGGGTVDPPNAAP